MKEKIEKESFQSGEIKIENTNRPRATSLSRMVRNPFINRSSDMTSAMQQSMKE